MLFLVLLYSLTSTSAVPTPCESASIASVAESTLAPSPDTEHTRTLANIIWNCVITILGCTWLVIHPNIPQPEEAAEDHRITLWSKITSTLKRSIRHKLPSFIMALIVPEYILAWAIRQWLVANELKRAGYANGKSGYISICS